MFPTHALTLPCSPPPVCGVADGDGEASLAGVYGALCDQDATCRNSARASSSAQNRHLFLLAKDSKKINHCKRHLNTFLLTSNQQQWPTVVESPVLAY